MRPMLIALLAAFAVGRAYAAPLDMETIMADPDWIGPPVEKPYFSADGNSIYYLLKHDGNKVRDLWRVPVQGGVPVMLDAEAQAQADGDPVFDKAHAHAAFVRHGDIFWRDLGTGRTVQVTRSDEGEISPRFMADGRLQYRGGDDWYIYDARSGISAKAATLKLGDDPDQHKDDSLTDEQLKIFSTLRGIRADKDAQHAQDRALDAADPTRAGRPFYLGKSVAIVDTTLSPDGRWMLVVTKPKGHDDGKAPKITHYVTESGYPEPEDARTYVGRNDGAPQSLVLLDLSGHASFNLKTDALPGIKDDPLAELRAKAIVRLRKAGKDDEADALKAPAVRPVYVNSEFGPGVVWSDDGQNVGIQLRAYDNKDRWIASVDFSSHALVSQHRLTDKAWVNWNFNDFGWLKDGRTLWYLSEETGYSQLYTKPVGGKATALTSGKFEVSHPALSPDGRSFFLRANREAPTSYDIYRVPAGGGSMEQVTHFKGMDDFALSGDGKHLAVLHSSSYVPSQLAVVDAGGGAPRELTDTRKPGYKAMQWVEPKIVQVPSSHGAGTIYAKYYAAPGADAASRPAVIFVHGAGYLQNVHQSFPVYFREQMFHNLLVQRGYVVLDMDYRASEGYGRDWRTAIYRNMGHPELEDLLDGKAWLVKEQHVDARRVGMYGGSYGGFMTLMSLFRAPGEFAAGAALRPVTDWSSYNQEYTSNILNDPQIDPEAYTTSSPIYYADQQRDPLLIMHGLIDDNVMASDSIRLYQRLIELHKKDFWISLYPMERHSFVHADSWHDEYRRIDELFHDKLGQ